MENGERLDEVVNEWLLRTQRGESVTIEDLCREFPELLSEAKSKIKGLLEYLTLALPPEMGSETVTSGQLNLSEIESFRGIPGYEILGELGRGGMGVVYKAKQIRADRIVALKVIRSAEMASAGEISRFRIEAEAIARLRHPNIVQVYEVGEYNKLPYFSLEYCNGGSLAEVLDGKPMNPVQAAIIIELLARAMHVAHAAKIVHRDLKPANILLHREESDYLERANDPFLSSTFSILPNSPAITLKVTDFGLAKQMDETGRTSTGSVMGTPSYMAPEQADGRTKEVGPPADIYALGVILYELLTGNVPFRGQTAMETIHQVIHKEPLRPSRRGIKLPSQIEAICLKCLEKQPHKRYSTAASIADDLANFRHGLVVSARHVGIVGRTWRWCRRNPAIASLLATVATSLIAGAVLASIFAFQATANARFAEKKAEEADRFAEEALQAKGQADTAREKAEHQLERAEWMLYSEAISKTLREWMADNPPLAFAALDGTRWDFRGWEYYYLRHQMRGTHLAFGHVAKITGLAYSPDGQGLLVSDQKAGLLRRQSQKVLRIPLESEEQVTCFAVNSNGRLLATSNRLGELLVWDVNTRKLLQRCDTKTSIEVIAFSYDSKRLVTGGDRCKLWEVGTGRLLDTLPEQQSYSTCIGFHPTQNLIYLNDRKSKRVTLWDIAAKKPRFVVAGQAVVLSPDGNQLAIVSADSLHVHFFNTSDGSILPEKIKSKNEIELITFSPDGTRVALGDNCNVIQLWDIKKAHQISSLKGHRDHISHLQFRPDGAELASSGYDLTIRLWNLIQPGSNLLALLPETVDQIAVNSSGDRLIVRADNSASLWDSKSFTKLCELDDPDDVSHVVFSPDDRYVLSGSTSSDDKGPTYVRLWDGITGKFIRLISQNKESISDVAFSSDGRLIALALYTTDQDGITISGIDRILETTTGAVVAERTHPDKNISNQILPGQGSQFFLLENDAVVIWNAKGTERQITIPNAKTMAVSRDGQLLATCGKDGTAFTIWNVETGKSLRVLHGNSGHIFTLLFSVDGKRIFSAGEDHAIRVWSVDQGREVLTLKEHTNQVNSLTQDRNGRLFSGGEDNTIRVHTILADEIKYFKVHTDAVSAVAWSPDGTQFVSAAAKEDRTLKVLAAATGREIMTLVGHEGGVNSVAYSPDGTSIVSTGHDGEIRIWDLKTGMQTTTLQGHFENVVTAEFSVDGKSIYAAASHFDKELRKWTASEIVVWDRFSSEQKSRWSTRAERISTVRLPSGGAFIAIGYADGVVEIRSTVSGEKLAEARPEPNDLLSLAISPNGKTLACGFASAQVHIINLPYLAEEQSFTMAIRGISSLSFGLDNRTLVVGNANAIRILDVADGKEFKAFGGTGDVNAISVSPDGRYALAGFSDNRTMIADLSALKAK